MKNLQIDGVWEVVSSLDDTVLNMGQATHKVTKMTERR